MRHLGFSIIIPTRRRSTVLTKTLLSLAKIIYPQSQFEVIVVDNDPEQSAQSVLQQLRPTLPQLRYLSEARQGASWARNTGIQAARFSYCVFIDDDVGVSSQFLQGYERAWRRYPQARVIGGSIQAQLDSGQALTPAEQVMLRKYGWCFAHLDWLKQDTSLPLGDILYSANMSYRRDDTDLHVLPRRRARAQHHQTDELEHVFNPQFGTQFYGDVQLGAEDYELCTRLLLQGEQVMFVADPDLQVTHYVPAARFSHQYLAERFCLAGIEIRALDESLQRRFPAYRSLYQKELKTRQMIWKLLTDSLERIMFVSYFFEGKYFTQV